MIIQGLQKLTLLDYPEKIAATIFTSGCNFRCPFCHNASLVVETDKYDKISEQEVLSFLKKRKGILEGVCISGGEPLLQHDIEEFIKKIKEMGYLVKLDTNGSYPEKLKRLVENKLVDYVAMDLKNSRLKYQETIGVKEFDLSSIEKSMRILLKGTVPYEFRTTLVKEFHRKSDIGDMARWIKGAEKYFLQQFVESDEMIVTGLHGYNEEIMKQALEVAREEVENAQIRGVS
ncbi:pyruvate formate lyase activating enzyme [Aequitasia blattaphilus]|uniref:Anaerobic ribonucleoside-triphosphate reductase activating protein n=1 Tax=Aequitasia blattaphilus TaxID=2949332 RepID=A0ABT1EDA5_9FIRM|nr:anaerobic ribonucleoside-triphosphate reductase activating protein [Aequitasia blattaphilus]MCP1102831.1 anaerobic ribonucleoside-triphosphate reductase activating protein [Aequitasia blattaphilus]MCR8615471.1 anaerobic ribonucleoside-triphosphate reductase activating protein [Aequitasia blattaphilus]